MPYKNMPESMWGKMDKCVEKVQGTGKAKDSAIAICYSSMMQGKGLRGMDDLLLEFKAAATKTEADGEHPASDYLVVEDSTAPSTWHLRVRSGGKPDHRLMGAAWAALHSGYRGNKYEGASKGDAVSKLKKMYSSEDMAVPSEKELSLFQIQQNLDESFHEEFCGGLFDHPNDPYGETGVAQPYIIDIFPAEDYVVVRAMEKTYKVSYKINEFGEVTFDALADWKEVAANVTWVEKELKGTGSLIVYKQANGKYRWIGFSSNAFRDGDKEIISTKALEDAVAEMDAKKDYGVLRYWHVGEPDPVLQVRGKGLDLATCDFSAVHNRVLIESGVFHDEQIAQAVAEKQNSTGLSIGFFHTADQPDEEGVYRNIKIFERSILPADHAANGLAALQVIEQKGENMLKDKLKALADMVGGEKAKQVVAQADTIEAKAKALGIEFKESAPEKLNDVQSLTLEAVNAAIEKAVKPLQEQLQSYQTTQVAATKELGQGVVDTLATIGDGITKMDARLKELESTQPRRATQGTEQVLTEEGKAKLKEKGAEPADDNKAKSFMEFVSGAPVAPAA